MSNFKSIKDILQQKKKNDTGKYISREFQDYGCRLAEELGETKRKSLYIKLSKKVPRTLLEEAKSYVLDYPSAKSKGALFMWKLKELRGTDDLKGKSQKTKKGKKKPKTERLL